MGAYRAPVPVRRCAPGHHRSLCDADRRGEQSGL